MPVGKIARFFFRMLPSIFLAEPFECFTIGYSLIIGIQIINAAFFGPSNPQLSVVLGQIGLIVWAAAIFLGAAITAYGLLRISRATVSAINARERRFEWVGLVILTIALGFYAVVLPFRPPIPDVSLAFSVIQTVMTEAILLLFSAATATRAMLVHSSTFLLAVNRLQRIRMMKEDLGVMKDADTGGDRQA